MPIIKTSFSASAAEANTSTISYDWVETTFDETPIMSTYLLAILVADYGCEKDIVLSKSGLNITSQVCTRKNAMDQLALARDSSIGALEALETLYNVPYPLPKLDHVSSPTFNFGAMENWGLAIYLERLFLKNENTTQTTEQRIVTIITHEIAHMWFGNLVTPKWWDDLWLNEGFARYMQFVGSNKLKPEWELLDQHVNMLLDVMDADAGNDVRALSQIANTPDEINAMVDPTITYGKGSGIVRMLNYVLGQEAFYEALTAYFEDHKYTNVDQFDLWLAMSKKGKEKNIQNLQNIDLASVMSKWTKQAGHPVVMVKLDSVNSQLIVTQKQFKRDPLTKQGNFKWTIPFTYSIERNDNQTKIYNMTIDNIMDSTNFKWIKSDEEVTIIDLNDSLTQYDFVLANIEMTGYFRVNYEPENWEKIIKQLYNDENIPSIMKAQLINDAFALSQSIDVEADLPLKIISAVSQSQNTEYLPWSAFFSRYSYYADMFYSSRIGSDLKERMATVIEPLFKSYKEEADRGTLTWNQRLLVPKVYSFACSHEVEECKSGAIDTFSIIIANSSFKEIDSELRQIVACTAIRHGSKAEFDSLFNLIDTEDSSMLDLISASLPCTRNRALLEKFLYKFQELGSNQHVQAIRNAIAYSGADDLVWSYIKTKWDILVSENSASTLKSLLEKITMKFKDKYQKDDFERFFELHPNIKLSKDIEVMKQKINTNRYWFNRSLETVNQFLVGQRNSEY